MGEWDTLPHHELESQQEKIQCEGKPPTVHVDLVARHYDLTAAERAFTASLANERSGHSRHEFITPNAKTTCRCPLKSCPNPHNPGKGCPINPNGLKRGYQSHRDLRKEVTVAVYNQGRLRQQFHLTCPGRNPQRKVIRPTDKRKRDEDVTAEMTSQQPNKKHRDATGGTSIPPSSSNTEPMDGAAGQMDKQDAALPNPQMGNLPIIAKKPVVNERPSENMAYSSPTQAHANPNGQQNSRQKKGATSEGPNEGTTTLPNTAFLADAPKNAATEHGIEFSCPTQGAPTSVTQEEMLYSPSLDTATMPSSTNRNQSPQTQQSVVYSPPMDTATRPDPPTQDHTYQSLHDADESPLSTERNAVDTPMKVLDEGGGAKEKGYDWEMGGEEKIGGEETQMIYLRSTESVASSQEMEFEGGSDMEGEEEEDEEEGSIIAPTGCT